MCKTKDAKWTGRIGRNFTLLSLIMKYTSQIIQPRKITVLAHRESPEKKRDDSAEHSPLQLLF